MEAGCQSQQDKGGLAALALQRGPGAQKSGESDPYGLGDRVTVVTPPVHEGMPGEAEPSEQILHLVQDEETIMELHQCALPPDEYYEKLARVWQEWWPDANPKLLEHMMSVCIAFDTATAFAMSFGIAKFSLAQIEAKLVGCLLYTSDAADE